MLPALVRLIVVLLASASIGLAAQGADRTETTVREVLQQYSTALASLDADAVKKVQPSVDVESLRKAFREMRTLDVVIDEVKVLSTDRSLARVSCRVTQTLTPRAGAKRSTTVSRVLRLRRLESGWVIESFER